MELKGKKLYISMLVTFILVFLMNYIGNSEAPDRMERALLTGFGGALGLGIAFWFMGRKQKKDDTHPDFD